MKIWSRKKCEYTTADNPRDALTSDYSGGECEYKCAKCGAVLTLKGGCVSHLLTPDNIEHDNQPAYVICKTCMDGELNEEKELIEKYGTYDLYGGEE